jgi:hypothetical protein
MGDRFWLKLKCAYCGTESSVYYAPTCGDYDFKCQDLGGYDFMPVESKTGCGGTNFVTASFEVKKAEDVTEEDVVQAFEMATSADHTLDAIKREAKSYLRNLQKRIKNRGH